MVVLTIDEFSEMEFYAPQPCGEHKLRNFKARYLTMKHTIREYSNLGKIAHLNSTKSK